MSASGLSIRDVSKTFAGQRALADVSVEFRSGEITALLGHNGSGKSTLIKILAGFYEPDHGGQVSVGGAPLDLPASPNNARDLGLRFVHQDLGLVDAMSIADNFAFADGFSTRSVLGPVNRSREYARVARTLKTFGIEEQPSRLVGDLDATHKTMIAIARSFAVDDDKPDREKVVILDEPTAALPPSEVHRVLDATRTVSEHGGTVIYVTHRVDEVLSIAGHVVVLREGRVVQDRPVSGLDNDAIVSMIVGGKLETGSMARRSPRSEIVFEASQLSGARLENLDLSLHKGEIVGIAGLIGCGRSELARIVAGVQSPIAGERKLLGERFAPSDPKDAIDQGVVYVPQDRRGQACIPEMSLHDNLTLGRLGEFMKHGWLSRRGEMRSVESAIEKYRVLPPDPRRLMAHFSGGNQQKAVVARSLHRDPVLLVLDEPMQGVDVGAKREIAEILRTVSERGVSILIGSTDFEDLIQLCDRVVVLNRGRYVSSLAGDELTEEQLALASTQEGT